MTADLEDAEAAFAHALKVRADQHRYIAEAQRELTARRSILPSIDEDVARARARLDAARGAPSPYPAHAERRAVQREVDMALHAARFPGRALADASVPHRFSGDLFAHECWVGQLHDGGVCGFQTGPEGITDELHDRP
ncbi:MAG: hypothetical protein J0J04_07885 [Microbacterium sp.]|uniref:hypothetical protein n=1 Tax=Microbacterium sp. TaxID=51671 RepID=UPI001AD151DE|nr:hypothetical protein [Microbacterium sp.]MBN9214719.1 hypothetical protein [Microbacterium sp.]